MNRIYLKLPLKVVNKSRFLKSKNRNNASLMALVNGLVYEFKIDLNVDTCKIQTALDGTEMFKRKRASLSTHLMLLQCLFLQILSRFPFAYTLLMHIT